MKITLIIVSVLLVIVGAGSGYFIASLNNNFDNLKTELAANYNSLGTKIDEAGTQLEGEIKAGDDALTASIQDNKSSISDVSQSVDTVNQKVSGLQNDLNTTAGKVNLLGGQINALGTSVAAAENIINDNVMQTAALYSDAKKAIVRITDGQQLSGSGFIMAGNVGTPTAGIPKIVTAYHVIANLGNIYVTLYDGRSWKAGVWASSQAADVAILQFTEGGADLPDMATLPALKLADSAAVQPGDPCFVIGSPGDSTDYLGLTETVTTGTVSQVHRAQVVSGDFYSNLIQVDAAINFGNSGGPLFNSRGEVIGIINSRISPTSGDGISFCIASNMIKRVEKIITNTSSEFKFDYPYLGVSMVDLAPVDIAAGNNAVTSGAKVVSANGPALAAGVQVNDIIISINGNPVRDSNALSSWVAENGTPGDTIVLTVVRGITTINISVTLGIRP